MSKPKPTPKKQATHSPLLRFRKRANCKNCPLAKDCKVDKTLELRCILTLIADTIHNAMRLKIMRAQHP